MIPSFLSLLSGRLDILSLRTIQNFIQVIITISQLSYSDRMVGIGPRIKSRAQENKWTLRFGNQ